MDTEINEPHINKRGAKIIRVGMEYDGAEVIALHVLTLQKENPLAHFNFKLGETLVHLSDDRIINFDNISWEVSDDK